MRALAGFLSRVPEARGVAVGVAALAATLFFIANVPWHLDNYDQAKQAFVAYEIVETGEWWFQTTPQGRSASKPPLMGWASAGLRLAGVPWEWAWRLPGLLCALVMLWIVAREGARITLGTGLANDGGECSGRVLGAAGAAVAAGAFGLNLLTPRLATLVRTDLMLAFFIFLAGWLIYRRVRDGGAWSCGEKWAFFFAMAGALFTKGPVIYAFLLPGIVAFALFAEPRDRRRLVWGTWWAWLVPLAAFMAWTGVGIATSEEFYEDVVVREFFSRFQEGSRSDERPQPWWFYFPHLLHKFAPWSVLLLALPALSADVRKRLRADPGAFWLLVWALGGLALMTLVPAKRVDRIYPVIPPLSLLAAHWAAAGWGSRRVRAATGGALVGAAGFAGGYFIGLVPLSYHEGTDALVRFCDEVRQYLDETDRSDAFRLARARDEGTLLYLGRLRFDDREAAFQAWRDGEPVVLMLSERNARRFEEEVGSFDPVLDSGELRRKNETRYLLYDSRSD